MFCMYVLLCGGVCAWSECSLVSICYLMVELLQTFQSVAHTGGICRIFSLQSLKKHTSDFLMQTQEIRVNSLRGAVMVPLWCCRGAGTLV